MSENLRKPELIVIAGPMGQVKLLLLKNSCITNGLKEQHISIQIM